MKIDIKSSRDNAKHIFTVTNNAGKVVFESKPYTRRHDTKRAVSRFITNLPLGNFETISKGSKHRFIMRGKKGGIVGHSPTWKRKGTATLIKNKLMKSDTSSYIINY